VLDSVTIDSSKFVGTVTNNSNSNNYSSVNGYNCEAAGLKIKNSTFNDGGGYAILLSGTSSHQTGLEISSNTFTNTYGGIYIVNFDSVTVRSNTIVGANMYSEGIYLNSCHGANVIEDNSIYCPDMSSGIYIQSCQASAGSEATIANNLISVEDNGIYLNYYNYYQNMYYNSVKVRDSYALYAYAYNNNNTLKNNIFYTESASLPAAYIYNTSVLDSSDYNDFYSSYSYPIYYSGNKTLAEWQAYGQDSNSVSIDPVYDTDSTLVPLALALDNKGTPIASITDDINGTTRSETTPDMGAIEFSVSGSPLTGSYTVGTGGDFAT